MKIRKMIIDDYEVVYKLWNNTHGMGMRNVDDSKEGIEKYLKRNAETCFVAEVENKIVGVILSGHDGRRGYIYHTAVSNTVRKHGIGTKLVNTAIEALKEQGINKVALVVFGTNELGNSFWESQGFKERNDLVYRNKILNDNNV
jgi:ribosomal protein S18 acetylase RimI-like enzyme